MTEKIYDYKKAFEDCAPVLLKMAADIEAGDGRPIAAKLRIMSAQFASAGAGWRELVPEGYPPPPE